VRRSLAIVLGALVCLVLAAPLDAPAQDAPAQDAPAQGVWDIAGIQRRLADLGYDAGEVDGLLGPKTRQALRAYQADRGLPATGLPDGPTQGLLFAAEPNGSVAEAQAPADDPPWLEAVPLEPVRSEPLLPLATADPPREPLVDRTADVAPIEPAPTVGTAGSLTYAPAPAKADREPWIAWLTWAAVALSAIAVLVFFAARRRRLGAQGPVDEDAPRPPTTPAAPPLRPAGVGHAFGVDVPLPVRDPRPD